MAAGVGAAFSGLARTESARLGIAGGPRASCGPVTRRRDLRSGPSKDAELGAGGDRAGIGAAGGAAGSASLLGPDLRSRRRVTGPHDARGPPTMPSRALSVRASPEKVAPPPAATAVDLGSVGGRAPPVDDSQVGLA